MQDLVLTMRLGEAADARSLVTDGLSDSLYALAAAGAIEDGDDRGWAYSDSPDNLADALVDFALASPRNLTTYEHDCIVAVVEALRRVSA